MYLHSSASNYPTLLRILAMYEKEESFSLTLANEVAFTIMRKRKVPRKRPMGADFVRFSPPQMINMHVQGLTTDTE